jgi:hypothetical protein
VATDSPEFVIVVITTLLGTLGRFDTSRVTFSDFLTALWIKRIEPIKVLDAVVLGAFGITANGTTRALFVVVVATSLPIKS